METFGELESSSGEYTRPEEDIINCHPVSLTTVNHVIKQEKSIEHESELSESSFIDDKDNVCNQVKKEQKFWNWKDEPTEGGNPKLYFDCHDDTPALVEASVKQEFEVDIDVNKAPFETIENEKAAVGIEDSKFFVGQFIDGNGTSSNRDGKLSENYILHDMKSMEDEGDLPEYVDVKSVVEEVKDKGRDSALEYNTVNLHSSQFKCQKKDSDDDLDNYDCDLCNYSTCRKGDLKLHMDKEHLKSIYKCELCFYSSDRKHNLKQHIDSVHLHLKNQKCHLCEYSTTHKSSLKQHLDSIHLQLKNHKCHLCDYSTTHRSNLKQHIDGVHSQMKNHKCSLCDYRTNLKGTLKKHVDYVHLNKQYKKTDCNLCEYKAPHYKMLQQHIYSVHKQQTHYKCNLCDYSAKHKSSIKTHVDGFHLRIKNQNCHLCDFKTYRRSNLTQHINSVHLKLRTHPCHLCEYSAAQAVILKKHIKLVHLKKND